MGRAQEQPLAFGLRLVQKTIRACFRVACPVLRIAFPFSEQALVFPDPKTALGFTILGFATELSRFGNLEKILYYINFWAISLHSSALSYMF